MTVRGSAGGDRSAVDIRRAELEGGSVSLMPLDQLQAVAQNLQDTTKAIRTESSNLEEQARAPLDQAGLMLANRWPEWPSQPFYGEIRRMIWLQTQEHDLNAWVEDLRSRQYKGFARLTQGMRDKSQAQS